MYAWSLGHIYTTWDGSDSDLQLKCGWLSQMVNISLFQFYGLCLKGFGSENGPLLRRSKSVPMRQQVLSQQIMVRPAPEYQTNHMLQLPKSSYPIGMHTLKYTHQTFVDGQTDHMTWVSQVLLQKRKGPCHMVEWGCDTESCVLSLSSFSHLSFPSAKSNTDCKWRVRRKPRVSVCESECVCLPRRWGAQTFIQSLAQCSLCRKDIRNKKQTWRFRSRLPELLRKTFRWCH